MCDLVEEELDFRGCTLQLSNAPGESGAGDGGPRLCAAPVHPSVLSGADSLSSNSSFSDALRNDNTTNERDSTVRTVYPRYDMPFSSENIKDFFSYRNGIVESAIQECITGLIFPESDGDLIGSWLLTEITSWDNEKERLVLLTSKMVVTIKYDFIAMKKLDFKKTLLTDLDTIVIGELVYPPSSIVPRLNGLATGVTTVVRDCIVDRWIKQAPHDASEEFKLFDTKYFEPSESPWQRVIEVPSNAISFLALQSTTLNRVENTYHIATDILRERNLRGIRLMWNKGQPMPLKTVWNPFSHDTPFLTFASHPVYWHKGTETVTERSTYDMESFAESIVRAVEQLGPADCCIHHSPIVIQSYVGVTSLLHNKNSLGFFKVRGKFSF